MAKIELLDLEFYHSLGMDQYTFKNKEELFENKMRFGNSNKQ